MIKIPINFHQTDDIIKFVKIANQYPFHMDLVSGNRAVDAKSLMGTLAMGHAAGLSLMIHSYPSPSTEQLLTQMQSFT